MRTRNTDKEILVKEKAIQMLVGEGLQGFGMNRLAKACEISVATLYIYYKDKDDLIRQIGREIGEQFMKGSLKGFSPEMPFGTGLKKQWQNRADFAIGNPSEMACYELLRNSSYGELILQESIKEFKQTMHRFCDNAIRNKELVPMSFEAFWSVAYGPLYTLLRFHQEGKSIGGKPFKFSKRTMNETFSIVLKGLTP